MSRRSKQDFLTKEEIAKMVRLRDDGVLQKDIAERMRCSIGTVSRILKDHDNALTSRKIDRAVSGYYCHKSGDLL